MFFFSLHNDPLKLSFHDVTSEECDFNAFNLHCFIKIDSIKQS